MIYFFTWSSFSITVLCTAECSETSRNLLLTTNIIFTIREILLDLKWEIQQKCKRNHNRPEQPERMTSLMLLLLAFFTRLPWVLSEEHYFTLTDDYDKYIPFPQCLWFFQLEHMNNLIFTPLSSSSPSPWSWSSPTLAPGLRSQDKSFPTPFQS